MGSSGAKTISIGPPLQSGPSDWRQIASVQDDSLSPRVVRIGVESLGVAAGSGLGDIYTTNQPLAVGCGVWWNPYEDVAESWTSGVAPWQGGAAMRVRWGGQHGFERTIYADLWPGEYNFGPCQFLEVSAARWNPEESESYDDWRVSAEIASGVSHESSPLTVTARRRASASSSSAVVVPPPGAYAFEAGGNEDAATSPGIIAYGGISPAQRVPGGAWTPPTTPILLRSPHVTVQRVSGATPIDEEGEGATGWDAVVVFFVR